MTVHKSITGSSAVEIAASGHALDKGRREVRFDGAWHDTPVLDGHALAPGKRIAGPAVVEYEHACTVLPPWADAVADRYGNLVIDLHAERAQHGDDGLGRCGSAGAEAVGVGGLEAVGASEVVECALVHRRARSRRRCFIGA